MVLRDIRLVLDSWLSNGTTPAQSSQRSKDILSRLPSFVFRYQSCVKYTSECLSPWRGVLVRNSYPFPWIKGHAYDLEFYIKFEAESPRICVLTSSTLSHLLGYISNCFFFCQTVAGNKIRSRMNNIALKIQHTSCLDDQLTKVPGDSFLKRMKRRLLHVHMHTFRRTGEQRCTKYFDNEPCLQFTQICHHQFALYFFDKNVFPLGPHSLNKAAAQGTFFSRQCS